mmetsp:Transcript_71502/g.155318  ORF Transcript_71502/g.155318 Transcript_71502/m.155318 type:complete len:210 (+) Transcript_71502:112-741(+)
MNCIPRHPCIDLILKQATQRPYFIAWNSAMLMRSSVDSPEPSLGAESSALRRKQRHRMQRQSRREQYPQHRSTANNAATTTVGQPSPAHHCEGAGAVGCNGSLCQPPTLKVTLTTGAPTSRTCTTNFETSWLDDRGRVSTLQEPAGVTVMTGTSDSVGLVHQLLGHRTTASGESCEAQPWAGRKVRLKSPSLIWKTLASTSPRTCCPEG